MSRLFWAVRPKHLSCISATRWTVAAANFAKGDLLDEEFLVLCHEVAEYVGRRILAAAGERVSE